MSDGEDDAYLDDAEDVSALLSADEAEPPDASQAAKDEAKAAKKRKRKEKEKERKAKKLKVAQATEAPELSVAAQPPVMLADYLSSMQAKTFSKMSSIELADMQIPVSSIADTTPWTGSRNLDQLVEFITNTLPTLRTRLAQRPKSNGTPTLMFIAGAALRVADVTRKLKDKTLLGEKGGDVAKLFARHIKLEEHVRYLKRTKLAAAVGTPGRLGKLLENDALSTAQLTHIILDISYRDAKKRNLLDIPETRDEIFKTVLGYPKVLAGIREGKIQVVLL
ncbi:hypothetical protein K474DRAFT_1594676 [Panus rudis PR-1116 ss-1]|nr:hypothetical protein K474DRAFT_1594676 [Panus rudis PR-1116 ss-1]